MFKYLKQKNNNKIRFKTANGFTLVETLVAIAIFSISIVGLMSVLANGISDINYSKNKMVASYLSQEGIEYVRNIRDTYMLYGVSGSKWSSFLGEINTCLDTGNGCYINYTFQDLDFDFLNTNNDVFRQCFPIGDPNDPCLLRYDNITGKYNHDPSYPYSGFRRKIYFSVNPNNSDEIKVDSEVTWSKGSNNYVVHVSSVLLKWKED